MASRIAELAGYGRRFGLLIADLDQFELVNDRHGHAAGDVALRTVARTLLESSRAGDDIARFGGEEFALTITDWTSQPCVRSRSGSVCWSSGRGSGWGSRTSR